MNLIVSLSIFLLIGPQLAVASTAPPVQTGEGNAFYSSVPSAYMDDPRRTEWQKPEKVVEHLLLKQGDTVADIGAGTGFFSMLFARKVGKNGVVYAVDIDENMVKHIGKRAKKEGLNNILPILAPADDPLLPKLSADLIFICDTYLFFNNREQYLSRLIDSMKNDGRLAIVSFNTRSEVPGAPPAHKMISRDQTVLEAYRAGFSLVAEFFFLPYHDFLVFEKRKFENRGAQ